ncbi:signal peptidase I [Spirochaetia bacterium]|nr:signal peptidase I [Spirochaetia bacterium]
MSASGSASGAGFFDRLQSLTEDFLSRRRQIRRVNKEKQKKKNFILDWGEAFLWAAGWVLIINQYLFQAYQIPSGSMINTLLIGDHIFVNKIIYGPELLPGFVKLPSPFKAKRNDIIIFENPSYISRGTVFDIAQRVIYMLTLTKVDIDKDESGSPKAHLLIKRAVGMAGDRFITERGNLRMLPAGENRWIDEGEFNRSRGFEHKLSRLIDEEEKDYLLMEAAGRAAAYTDMNLSAPAALSVLAEGEKRLYISDSFARERARLGLIRAAFPQEARFRTVLAKHIQGWYVSEGRILPLGDNRDNSRDGRYFGPVRVSKILGRASIRYWPGGLSLRNLNVLERLGSIK